MKSQEANAIPLREILEKYGHEPVRSYHGYLMYSSPFRNEETPSFMVNLHTNKWKDFGEDSSGGVADLVMRLERRDFTPPCGGLKSDLSAPSDPPPCSDFRRGCRHQPQTDCRQYQSPDQQDASGIHGPAWN